MRTAAVAVSATAAALILAHSALGHGSVQPTVAEPAATERFTFQVLNERETPMVGLRLEVPPGARIVDMPAKSRWQAFQIGSVVVWRGLAPARGSESFPLLVRLPRGEGTVSFTANELFADGSGPPFRLNVVLASDIRTGDDGIGAVEVFAAIGVAALLMALGLLLLRRRG